MDSLNLVDQLSQLLAGIKHAGLHGDGGNAEDVCGVLHRLLVIIGKVNDLVVLGGELSYCLAQQFVAALLLQRNSGVGAVGHGRFDGFVLLRMGPTPSGRERLEARDRKQPRGDGGAPLIAASLLPTSRNTSLRRSSATVSLPTNRKSQR